MDLDEMIKTVKEMQRKQLQYQQQKNNGCEAKLDPKGFNLENVSQLMISSVNYLLLYLDCDDLPVDCAEKIFNVTYKSVRIYSDSEIEEAIDYVINTLKEKGIEDDVFPRVFNPEYYLEKNRIRAIINGKSKDKIISKEKENVVLSYYLSIFKTQLQYFFDLITLDNYYLSYFPYVLKLFSAEGTQSNRINPEKFLNSFISKIPNRVLELLKPILYKWYQENNLTFVHDNLSELDADKLSKYHFLLSKKQKLKAIEELKEIYETKLSDLMKKDKRVIVFSNFHLHDIEELDSLLTKLKEVERSFLNDKDSND